MKWKYQSSHIPKDLRHLEQILLKNRKISKVDKFFSPPNPLEFSLKELAISEAEIKSAVERIQQAQANQESILIFGDYDADGITASAVLYQTLDKVDCKVQSFIPDRVKHGYGLSVTALQEIIDHDRPDLIITVDNGIVAHPAADFLAEQRIDLIISDHHLPEENLPQAKAVVHTTKLAGSGVAWVLAREVYTSFKHKNFNFISDLLDLVAIGTVADQMVLLDANRSIVFHGLKKLKSTKRLGLLTLMKVSKVDPQKVTVNTINYGLGPRINAIGRLKNGRKALDLLLSEDYVEARNLASDLSSINTRRQDLTEDWLKTAQTRAEKNSDEKIIVVYGEEYHEGVIGLIAGRLVEKFYKPSIVMTSSDNTVKASARSIPGVNIIDLIREVKDHLLDAGGHPMAAGFSLESKKVEMVKDLLFDLARAEVSDDQLEPILYAECVLPFSFVNFDLIKLLNKFEPFGNGNDRPIFALKNLKVLDAFTMGRDNSHLKLVVADNNAQGKYSAKTLQCIGWRMGEQATELDKGSLIEILGVPELNVWNGRKSIQFVLRDVRVSSL